MKLAHTFCLTILLLTIIVSKFVTKDVNLFNMSVLIFATWSVSLFVTVIGLEYDKHIEQFNSPEEIVIKAKPLVKHYSYKEFLDISSKELYDEFFNSCFKLEFYSQESQETYYNLNIYHFNDLLQNELKKV